ncbi:MAG: hypothetical protein LUE14_05340 [Clostridiales bacterium]|nr:hypothetical protein [Clostridiales bacterium]
MKFYDEKSFLGYLREADRSTEFIRCRVRDIHFKESEKVDTSAFSLADLHACSDDPSGLWVETPKYEFPVKKEALAAFFNCIGIRGTALKRLNRTDLRMVLNKCTKGNEKPAWIRVEDGAAVACMKDEPPARLEERYREIKGNIHRCTFVSAVDNGPDIVLVLEKSGHRYVFTLEK